MKVERIRLRAGQALGQRQALVNGEQCRFLVSWARRLSWNEVARAFRTTWDQVFSSVEMAVSWGREHQNLEGIEAIGVDEIAWQRGHRYLTLVYQIDAGCRRLLWQAQHRGCGLARRVRPGRYCASFVAKQAGHALHILDRFHIMAQLGKAIDEVRAEEARKLKCEGYEPILISTR